MSIKTCLEPPLAQLLAGRGGVVVVVGEGVGDEEDLLDAGGGEEVADVGLGCNSIDILDLG